MAISQYLIELRKHRDALADNLVKMGVSADKSEKLNTLVPKVLKISNNKPKILYDSESSMMYEDDIAIFYNEGYHTMSDFRKQYANFYSDGISITQEDFNWDAHITIIPMTEFSVNSGSSILMKYTSGASEVGEMYLIPKPTHPIDVSIAVYLYGEIKYSRVEHLSFQWLGSDTAITTLTDVNISGTYYLAFVARGNNTHPTIKKIGVIT